jgi:uncharacterized protein (UPF0261 family)
VTKPRIVCAGMCNTKGTEIRYLARTVAEYGGEPITMDLSLGEAVDWADVSLQEVRRRWTSIERQPARGRRPSNGGR